MLYHCALGWKRCSTSYPPPAAPLLLCSDLARMVTGSTGFNERRDVFLQHITGCLQCRWRHTADVAIATTARAAFAGVAAATTATAPARTVASPLTHLRFCAGGPRVAKLGVKTTVTPLLLQGQPLDEITVGATVYVDCGSLVPAMVTRIEHKGRGAVAPRVFVDAYTQAKDRGYSRKWSMFSCFAFNGFELTCGLFTLQ